MIGIDEVGRGPLAGPVVVCACWLHDEVVVTDIFPKGVIKDSKKLSSKQRQEIIGRIDVLKKKKQAASAIGIRSSAFIDEKGIAPCIRECVSDALASLGRKKDEMICLDGGLAAPEIYTNTLAIVRGDSEILSIACASIIAKEYRDKEMEEYGKQYPVYGFEKHSGYGTAFHIQAIKDNGTVGIHRQSFLKNVFLEMEIEGII